jgi:hypothetical protein
MKKFLNDCKEHAEGNAGRLPDCIVHIFKDEYNLPEEEAVACLLDSGIFCRISDGFMLTLD